MNTFDKILLGIGIGIALALSGVFYFGFVLTAIGSVVGLLLTIVALLLLS